MGDKSTAIEEQQAVKSWSAAIFETFPLLYYPSFAFGNNNLQNIITMSNNNELRDEESEREK